jgi:hypothetical protein
LISMGLVKNHVFFAEVLEGGLEVGSVDIDLSYFLKVF